MTQAVILATSLLQTDHLASVTALPRWQGRHLEPYQGNKQALLSLLGGSSAQEEPAVSKTQETTGVFS